MAYALEREVEVGFSRVAAVLGPFCFSWSYACYLDYLLGTLQGGEPETLTVAGEEDARRRGVEVGHDRPKSDLDMGLHVRGYCICHSFHIREFQTIISR